MKIHGRRNNPNYWRNVFATCPLVLINGASIDHVVEADNIEGYVVVELWGRSGPQVKDGNIVTRRIKGNVEFSGADLLPHVAETH